MHLQQSESIFQASEFAFEKIEGDPWPTQNCLKPVADAFQVQCSRCDFFGQLLWGESKTE